MLHQFVMQPNDVIHDDKTTEVKNTRKIFKKNVKRILNNA